MQLLKWGLVGVPFIVAAATLLADETVSNQKLGFRLTVPDGFISDPKRVQGTVIYLFQRPPAKEEKMGMFIVVSGLGGVLGREKIDPRTIAAKNPQVTIVSETWKDFDIEVFRVPEKTGELQLVTFNAQVPLKPEAVQVAVIGEAAKESELRSLLRSILRSLEGETNWLNPEQRISRFAEGITRLTIMGGVLLVIVVGVAVVVWRFARKRKSVRGREEGAT